MVLCDMWFFCTIKKKIQKSNTCLPACERDRGEPRADWAALPCLSWELGQSCSRGAAPACKGLQEVQAGLSLAPGTWLIAHGHWSSKNSLFLFHSLQILTCLTTPSMKSFSWVLSIQKKKKRQKSSLKKVFLSQKSLQCSRDSCTAVWTLHTQCLLGAGSPSSFPWEWGKGGTGDGNSSNACVLAAGPRLQGFHVSQRIFNTVR